MVSWHDLGFGLVALLSFFGLCVGLLMVFAGGMSSAPAEGSKVTNRGLIVAAVALVLLVTSCVKVF